MKSILIFYLLLLFPYTLYCQNDLKSHPSKFKETIPFNEYHKLELTKQKELLKISDRNQAELNHLEILLEQFDESKEDIWEVVGGACSWYCAGVHYQVRSSSRLRSIGENKYSAPSSMDFSYKTAWVEGKEGDGIGEYIEYHFKNQSPRITTIFIANGYLKSDYAWKNNNRVKKLKLYVNGKPYAILDLKDSKRDQQFDVGTFGQNTDGSDLVLRFEIMEVYKGEKYDDTAISEIYFDGIDVH